MRSRRRWIWVTLAAGLALLACMRLVGDGGGDRGGRVLGDIRWSLASVSADARTVTITHEAPHCTSHASAPQIREDARSVTITVREISDDVPDEVICTLELRIASEEVKLAAPLGHRRLLQPGKDPRRATRSTTDTPDPGMQECAQLAKLPADAAVRDVPWMQRRLRLCTASLPARFTRLPIFARPRTDADRLPRVIERNLNGELSQSFTILRPAQSRRIVAAAQIWLIPGPETSCIGRLIDGQARITGCQPTSAVARRGLLLSNSCTQQTPTRIDVLGLAPAGVDRVRIVPRRATARWQSVRDGSWIARRVPYPLEVRFGETSLQTTYETRACWD